MTREDADYSDWGQIEEKNENVIDVLDKIKTEIEKQIERDFAFAETETQKVTYHYGIATGLQNAIRIIDSVINAESEE